MISACDGSGVSSSLELNANESTTQHYSLRFNFKQFGDSKFSFTPIIEPAIEGGEYKWYFDGDIYEEDKGHVNVSNPTIRYLNSGVYYVYYELTINGKTYLSTAKLIECNPGSETLMNETKNYSLLENNEVSSSAESSEYTSNEVSGESYE